MDAVYRPAYPGHLSSPLLFLTSESTDNRRVFQYSPQSHNRAHRFLHIGIDCHRNMLVSKQGTLHKSDIGKCVIWKEVTELSKEESSRMAMDI